MIAQAGPLAGSNRRTKFERRIGRRLMFFIRQLFNLSWWLLQHRGRADPIGVERRLAGGVFFTIAEGLVPACPPNSAPTRCAPDLEPSMC